MARSNAASRNSQRLDRDAIETAPGYTSNAESEFTRRISTGGKADLSRKREWQEFTRLDWQIQREVSELLRHQKRAQETQDPAEVAKHIERAQKTKRFLDRLRLEQRRGANAIPS